MHAVCQGHCRSCRWVCSQVIVTAQAGVGVATLSSFAQTVWTRCHRLRRGVGVATRGVHCQVVVTTCAGSGGPSHRGVQPGCCHCTQGALWTHGCCSCGLCGHVVVVV